MICQIRTCCENLYLKTSITYYSIIMTMLWPEELDLAQFVTECCCSKSRWKITSGLYILTTFVLQCPS